MEGKDTTPLAITLCWRSVVMRRTRSSARVVNSAGARQRVLLQRVSLSRSNAKHGVLHKRHNVRVLYTVKRQ